jgi:ribosomal protein S10
MLSTSRAPARAPAAPRGARVRAAPRAAVADAAAPADKLRIKLKSYMSGPIVEAAATIKAAAEATGATVAGPVPLPTR